MLYVCQLYFDKGWPLPRWQRAFGHRFRGILSIEPKCLDGMWTSVAWLQPLDGQPNPEVWPRALHNVTQMQEDREVRYLSGVELYRTPTADRWLQQVWCLTQLPARELAEVEQVAMQGVQRTP